MDVNKVAGLWVELTGVDIDAKNINLKNLSIRSVNNEIKEALKLDATGITALSIMDYFVKEYFNERTFTINETIEDFDGFIDYLKKSKELYALLRTEEMENFRVQYKKALESSIKSIGVENLDVFKMLENRDEIAFLRRDALRSIENLKVSQFYKGEKSSERLTYLKDVYGFKNVNSLIKAMNETVDSGVSLNLIYDEMNTESYFVFAVKNGGNLVLLSDKPEHAHPMQKHMIRRPDRDLAERIFKNHFPYALLNIDFNSKGGAYVKTTSNLDIYDTSHSVLGSIKNLMPDEIIWIVLMFSLIEHKFFKNDFSLEELSYTGDMIDNKLLVDNITNLPTVSNYKTLEVEPLTSKDVSTDNMENEWGFKPTKKYKWIEERYESTIDENQLNIVFNDDNVLQLTSSIVNTGCFCDKTKKYDLKAVSPTEFGTKAEIEKNRRWTARYNKVQMLQKALDEEYKTTYNDVMDWFKTKVTENSEKLFEFIARQECIEEYYGYFDCFDKKGANKQKNILSLHSAKDIYDGMFSSVTLRLYGENERCFYDSLKPATLKGIFKPKTVQGLMLLTGCNDILEFPEILRHWTTQYPYDGNSILDNCDPLDWVIDNPWDKINFVVSVGFSKDAYNKERKRMGLPQNKFWKEN